MHFTGQSDPQETLSSRSFKKFCVHKLTIKPFTLINFYVLFLIKLVPEAVRLKQYIFPTNGFVAGQAVLKVESKKVKKHTKACEDNQHTFGGIHL
ncbi:hypothetical protein Hanom_Chr05g00450831 [Helianthus anomalus]